MSTDATTLDGAPSAGTVRVLSVLMPDNVDSVVPFELRLQFSGAREAMTIHEHLTWCQSSEAILPSTKRPSSARLAEGSSPRIEA